MSANVKFFINVPVKVSIPKGAIMRIRHLNEGSRLPVSIPKGAIMSRTASRIGRNNQVSIPKGAIMSTSDREAAIAIASFNSKRCDYEFSAFCPYLLPCLFQFQKVRL